MLNRSKLWMNISASRVVMRRGLCRPASWVKVLLTGQLSSSPRCGPARAVAAGLGRCVAGDRSVQSLTQCRGPQWFPHLLYWEPQWTSEPPQFWKITLCKDSGHQSWGGSIEWWRGSSRAWFDSWLLCSTLDLDQIILYNSVSSSTVRRWW